jgi:hypothetical protein
MIGVGALGASSTVANADNQSVRRAAPPAATASRTAAAQQTKVSAIVTPARAASRAVRPSVRQP